MPQTAADRSPSLVPFQIVMGATTAAVGGIVAVLGEIRSELNVGGTSIGIIVASGFISSFVAQIALSPLADRGYGRIMAIYGTIISALALFLMSQADSVTVWIVARSMVGFAGGMLLPGLRRAATVLDPQRSGENLGKLAASEIFGFMIGPVAAAALVEVGDAHLPFIVFGVAMILFLPVVFRLPPDNGRQSTRTQNPLGLLRYRRLQGAIILVSGYFLMVGAFESVLPLMFTDRGGSAFHIGLAFTAFCIPIMAVSRHAGRLADRHSAAHIAIAGMAISTFFVLTYGFIPGLLWLVIVMMIAGIADGYGYTAGQVAVSQSVPEDRQAAALGLMGAAEVLAAGMSALPSAALYEHHGDKVAWLAVGSSTLIILAIGTSRLRGTQPISHAASSH
jgi:MFS family permease